MTQGGSDSERNREEAAPRRSALLARCVIFIERFSPIFVVSAGPVLLIAIFSLFEVWALTPQWAHAIAVLAALILTALIAYTRWRPGIFPQRGEALARLELDGGVRHDALRALEDSPASGAGPLWDAHLADMRRRAAAARLGWPRPTANEVDPNGLRYAALALLAAGLVDAGTEAPFRLASGFVPADPRANEAGFADVWIEPPAYTGKAPIYLLRGDDILAGRRKPVSAPEGSIVHAQINARSAARLLFRSDQGTHKGERSGPVKSLRFTLKIGASGDVILKAGGRTGRWPVDVIVDRAPTAEFIETPAADQNSRLKLTVKFDDDYGVAGATLRLRLSPDQERPLDAPSFSSTALDESRDLEIDGAAGPSGARSFNLDLQAEPWAGLKVFAAVIARDSAGKTSETPPVEITLPKKAFFNPLAKAVLEQRQTLAVAPNEWRRAEWAFSGMTLGPEFFFESTSDYLLLRTAMWRISKEAGGDYKDAVDDFWPLALQLEDEALELARRRLDAARDALRNALEAGASDSEIERLTEEMRAALQQYLQALAQSGQQTADEAAPADEIVNSADLESMLDSIRDLAKSGAGGAARQALSELESLLNNLRMSNRGQSRSGQGGSGSPGESGGVAGQAGDLIGRQRELADKSYERGQKRGASGDDLGDEQGGLAGELSELMKALEGAGEASDPDGKAALALGQALGAMRRSQEALTGEEFESANEAMERAIASLREGAETIARAQGAEARRQGGGDGGGASFSQDPLGRQVGKSYGQGPDVPEKSDAQKTRELLEELRRRLSEGGRTEDEIKYLERLLERF